MRKVKKGDKVKIIAGKDNGREGTVLRILPESDRVVVEGINLIKKHMRGNPQKNEQGGIIEKEAAFHISNVALINPATGKADRVGFKILKDGRKVRYFKSNDEMVDA